MTPDLDWTAANQSPSFCALPWMHVAIRHDGKLRPCCRFENEGPASVPGESLQRTLEGPGFQDLRERMLRGETVPGCRQCGQEERLQARSKRMTMNEDYRPYWSSAPRLRYVEFPLSNVCNLKCRGCNSNWSTKWAADERRLGNPAESIAAPWENSLDLLDGAWADLRVIKILGGEPFLSPNHEAFLEKLALHGDLSKVEIHYATNGTQRPSDSVLEIWKKLKLVSIDFSVDGLRERNDYFREGSRWQDVVENIHWFQTRVHPNNRAFGAHTVVSIYNIHDLFEIDEWLSAEFPGIFLTKACLADPAPLALQNLPATEKDELVRHYAGCEAEPRLTNTRRRWYKALQNFLKQPAIRGFEDFLEHDRKLSALRGRRLEDFHPRLAELAREVTVPTGPALFLSSEN